MSQVAGPVPGEPSWFQGARAATDALPSGLPEVSVCIPVYNGAATLAATLASILSETSPVFEVVVLDNASTDDTAALLSAYTDSRLRVVTNPVTVPLADNWNLAVRLARGKYVKVVCADDLIKPGALEIQARVLRQENDVALVAARRDMVDVQGEVIAPARGLRRLIGRMAGEKVIRRVVLSGQNPIGEGAGVMFRQVDFIAVDGFHGERVFPMDIDLWVRLLRRGDFVGLPESMAAFRIGLTSASALATADQHHEYLGFVRSVAATPDSGLRRGDLTANAVRAQFSRLRRTMLFRFVRTSPRTQARVRRVTQACGKRS